MNAKAKMYNKGKKIEENKIFSLLRNQTFT